MIIPQAPTSVELDTTLLTIVGLMIGTGVAVLKWLMGRNDKMWDWMRKEEDEVHAVIVAALADIAKTQRDLRDTQLEIIRLLKGVTTS